MHAINYEFIQNDGMGLIREEAGGAGQEVRLQVLLALWASANSGNQRSWLCRNSLKERVRVNNNEAVAGALEFLVEHGAIYEVPIEFREGNEPKHKQIRVWQLTGMIHLNGQWMQYLRPEKGADYFEWLTQKTIAMGIQTSFLNLSSDTNSSSDTTGRNDNLSSDPTSSSSVTRHEGKSDSEVVKEPILDVPSRAVSSDAPKPKKPIYNSVSQMPPDGIKAVTSTKEGTKKDEHGQSELVAYLYGFHRKQMNKVHLTKLATNRTFYLEGGEIKFGAPEDLFVTDPRFKLYVDDMIAACKRRNNDHIDWQTLIGLICNFDRETTGMLGWAKWQKTVPLAPDAKPVKKEEELEYVDVELDLS